MYRLTENQISSELGGETVILNHADGVYYGLDEVGTFVWQLLQKAPVNFDALKEQIIANFEVDEQTCIQDLHELLTQLMNEKLVEEI